MSVVVIGLNHRSTPLDLLERMTIGGAQLPKALHDLVSREDVSEAVVLSTCNRTEVYAVGGTAEAVELVSLALSGVLPAPTHEIEPDVRRMRPNDGFFACAEACGDDTYCMGVCVIAFCPPSQRDCF